MKNKIFSILFAVSVFFFIICFSIGLPIYFRFFYYWQINALSLSEISGESYSDIKFAYDQMLNYLTLPNRDFSTGVFAFTESGKAHFEDCKILFNLNLIVLLSSLSVMILTFILEKKNIIKLSRPFNMNVSFISAASIFVVFFILALIVAIDFDSAFIVFHHIFFPGKDNWQFNPYEMEIISVLPAQFFLNCAILIGASIFLISSSIIVYQLVKKFRKNKKNSQ